MFNSVKSLTQFFTLNPTYIRLTSKSVSLLQVSYFSPSRLANAGFGFAGN